MTDQARELAEKYADSEECDSIAGAYLAGHASRDAEVDELKRQLACSKIAGSDWDRLALQVSEMREALGRVRKFDMQSEPGGGIPAGVRHILEKALDLTQTAAEKRVAGYREALTNFSMNCIKPECKCWACEALKGGSDE